ncbi:MAG: C1 family peptidase [Phycisphaerales bacterium]|nr:C1 family peptidase [Phycisphaerales bacterium]
MTTAPTQPTTDFPAEAAISNDRIDSLRAEFDSNARWGLSQNAITQVGIDDVALNRGVVTSTDYTFSTLLDDWKVTNQRQSGRCWMFAALNLFRVGAMKAMNLKNFEFSQNYTLFWDKFERANWFLEGIIETASRDIDDRTVAFLLSHPVDDGGQWNMFINIVKKHGLVPKAVMPEAKSSSATRGMNSVLVWYLRGFAKDLRDTINGGGSAEAARDLKDKQLAVIWRILCMHLGTPPTEFNWQWNDKDKEFHRDGMMTPQAFAKKYVNIDLDDYVCIVNDPRPTSPVGRTFTVEYLGNVVGGTPVKYLNVDMDVIRDTTAAVLQDGEPVWFGCDVGKMFRRDIGIWDTNLFNYESLYEAPLTLDKSDRLLYQQSLMTHAMLFTGVDVHPEGISRWRVENSWGEDRVGRKGFQVMNDNWFDEYVLEIAAHRNRLSPELQAACDEDPIVLAPWDPMGSLAY